MQLTVRDKRIDVLRGIGIVLMIYGHAAKYTSFVALFHMAVFFIASGYCFCPEKVRGTRNLVKYFARKIQSLWVPYFAYETIYILLHNSFICMNFYTDNPAFLTDCSNPITKLFNKMSANEMATQIVKNALFQGDTQIGGALWFLQTLFFATVLYGVVQFILQRMFSKDYVILGMQGIISIVFLLVGYYCSVHGITAKHLDRVMSCYWMLFAGYAIRQYALMDKLFEKMNKVICAFFSTIILVISLSFGKVSLNANMYPNPLFLVVVSIVGWVLLYAVADILSGDHFIGRFLQYISMHSIPVIALHFLSFKIVTAICVQVTGMAHYMLAAFPVLSFQWYWCIFYMIVGLGLPLLLDAGFRASFRYIKHGQKVSM